MPKLAEAVKELVDSDNYSLAAGEEPEYNQDEVPPFVPDGDPLAEAVAAEEKYNIP